MTFTIKRGDTSPNIEFELRDADGSRKDISGYNDVSFYMRDRDTEGVVISDNTSGNVIVTDAQRGEVEYDWQSGDTESVSTYDAELEVEFGNGKIETFPNNGFVEIEIVGDIV